MPFNPNYQYGTNADAVSFASVPANGRRVVTADFALLYLTGVTGLPTSVGLVQRIAPTENRPVQAQFEIGDIYPVEFIPQPWSGTIQVARLEIFLNQLYKAFGFDNGINAYGLAPYWPQDKYSNGVPIVTSLADIQWPIDMSIHIMNPPITQTVTVKTYVECWITNFGVSYDAGAKIVAENVSFVYRNTTITDVPTASIAGLTGNNGLTTQAV